MMAGVRAAQILGTFRKARISCPDAMVL